MAGESKQIYQLTTRDFDGGVLVPFDTPNTDPSTQAQKPYVSGKASGNAVADFVANTEEYTTDLDTVDKHINGAINELHAINGYSYDAYDDTVTYAVGDLRIYNNALYKCTTAITTPEAWNASHWTATSIADEISELNTNKADTSDITASALRSTLILDNFCVYSAERILANSSKSILLTQNLFILFIKSYSNNGCYGAYLISYHPSVATSNYISTLAIGNAFVPALSITDGNKLKIDTSTIDVYYSMMRLN